MSLHRRLGDESGMSLVELLVTVMIGMIVLLTLGNLLDATGRASAEVHDRVDAVQRGRVAMEQITQRLRSQVCLNTSLPAVVYATGDDILFYTDLVDPAAADFSAEARRLRFVPGASGQNGSIVEDVWDTVVIKPDPPQPADPVQTAVATFFRPPSRTRTVIADVALAEDADAEDRDGDGDTAEVVPQPLFDYYRFSSAPVKPDDRLQPPLDLDDADDDDELERVVRIVASFDARPTRGPRTREAIDTRFETDIFVRTADPTDPDHSPSCL